MWIACSRGAVSHYSREQTIRWLSWLARGMQRQGHMEYFAALPDTQRPVPLTNVDIPHCGAEKLKGGRPKKAV